jgi:hypothetical protein
MFSHFSYLELQDRNSNLILLLTNTNLLLNHSITEIRYIINSLLFTPQAE